MGKLLNPSSTMMCPHGGTVSATSSNTRAKVDGAPILRGSDTFTISGCPFTLPGPTAHPCTTVKWVKTCMSTSAVGDFALAEDSVGMCHAADQAPQGNVMVQATQYKGDAL